AAGVAGAVPGRERPAADGRTDVQCTRSGARQAVPPDGGRGTPRPRVARGEGAGWVLRHAPRARSTVRLHERGGRPRGCHYAVARGGSLLPRVRLAPAAVHLA